MISDKTMHVRPNTLHLGINLNKRREGSYAVKDTGFWTGGHELKNNSSWKRGKKYP